MRGEPLEDTRALPFAAGAVPVHSDDTPAWKELFQFKFELLCAEPVRPQSFMTTGRTVLPRLQMKTTIMTGKAIFFQVVG
jgi:hypothetical protein